MREFAITPSLSEGQILEMMPGIVESEIHHMMIPRFYECHADFDPFFFFDNLMVRRM